MNSFKFALNLIIILLVRRVLYILNQLYYHKNFLKMLCLKLSQGQQCVIPAKPNNCFVLNNIALDLDANEGALFYLPKSEDEGGLPNQSQKEKSNKEILIASLTRVSGYRSINLCLQFGVGQQVIFRCVGGCIHIMGGFKKYNDDNQKKINQQRDSKSMGKNVQIKKISRQKEQELINQRQEEQISKRQIENNQKMRQQSSLAPPQQVQTIRRSTRARAPAKPVQKVSVRSAKRQKQELKNMAQYFQCNLDDDDDDSFSKQQQDQDDDDQQSEQFQYEELIKNEDSGRKKHNKDSSSEEKKNSNKSNQSEKNEQTSAISSQSLHFSVPTKNPYV